MLRLTIEDLYKPSTHTFDMVNRHKRTIETLEKQIARERDFLFTLENYLQSNKEISWEKYNYLVACLHQSNKSVEEIFEEIKIKGIDNAQP